MSHNREPRTLLALTEDQIAALRTTFSKQTINAAIRLVGRSIASAEKCPPSNKNKKCSFPCSTNYDHFIINNIISCTNEHCANHNHGRCSLAKNTAIKEVPRKTHLKNFKKKIEKGTTYHSSVAKCNLCNGKLMAQNGMISCTTLGCPNWIG